LADWDGYVLARLGVMFVGNRCLVKYISQANNEGYLLKSILLLVIQLLYIFLMLVESCFFSIIRGLQIDI